jgi:hypothetical protein
VNEEKAEMQEQFVRQHSVTWAELVIREHRLAQLKRRAELARDDGTAASFCANAHWYGDGDRAPGLQVRLARLIGPGARPGEPVLGTQAALDMASTILRAILPPCRGCTCPQRSATRW